MSRNRFRLWMVVVLGALCASTLFVRAQTPTYSVDVKVVNVLATARDKHGAIVRDLNQDDFTLEEDGRPQVIKYFSRETDLPLTLGLLVDTSLSQRRVLGEERTASYSFLDQVLRPDRDHAFVIHFDEQVELLQDITASKQKLEAALREIEINNPRQDDNASGGSYPGGRSGGGSGGGWPGGGRSGGGWPGGGGRYPRGGGYPGGGSPGGGGRHGGAARGTLLYDSVYLAADELMKNQQGRKALIILSDGVDQGSRTALETAIEQAQRTDTLVYGILFYDENAYQRPSWGGGRGRFPQPDDRADGKKILQRISSETGGRFFEVSKKEPIEKIYADLQEELRNQYNLGYKSDRPATDSGYRKIHVAAKRKDVNVHARDGYYAQPARETQARGN